MKTVILWVFRGMMNNKEMRAPIIGVARHRIGTDGKGVATLVGFYGCPLRCRYCLNPHSFAEDTKRQTVTPNELYERVKIDQLYFLATGGGVTFGGGEPLLYPEFLRQFRECCGRDWRLSIETSLSVSEEAVRIAAEVIDEFIIDCKDTDPEIYRAYTGKENDAMMRNLSVLLSLVPPDRVLLRLPLIPDFNDESHRRESRARLSEMGVSRFDEFSYTIKK